jgi:hypothetical protein
MQQVTVYTFQRLTISPVINRIIGVHEA